MKKLKRYHIHIEMSKHDGTVYTTTVKLPKGSTILSILGENVGQYGYHQADSYIEFHLSVLKAISSEMTQYKLLIIKDSVSNINIDDEYTFLGSSVNHYLNDVNDLIFYHYDVFYKEL